MPNKSLPQLSVVLVCACLLVVSCDEKPKLTARPVDLDSVKTTWPDRVTFDELEDLYPQYRDRTFRPCEKTDYDGTKYRTLYTMLRRNTEDLPLTLIELRGVRLRLEVEKLSRKEIAQQGLVCTATLHLEEERSGEGFFRFYNIHQHQWEETNHPVSKLPRSVKIQKVRTSWNFSETGQMPYIAFPNGDCETLASGKTLPLKSTAFLEPTPTPTPSPTPSPTP